MRSVQMGAPPSETATTYTAIPLAGLVANDHLPFALYLRTKDNAWVLYHPADSELDESHVGRLRAEGVGNLFIRDDDRDEYFRRVEDSLDQVLLDRKLPLERRADLLYGVANVVASEILAAPLDEPGIGRARKLMMATSGLVLRENQGFHAVRRVLTASPELAQHSLTVGFLSMGLARLVLGGDAGTLSEAGLAGLLHDVGKVGHEDLDHDPEHTTRGAERLRQLELPQCIVEVAELHHECHDGSGYPHGLRGDEIPELVKIVALVNTFDEVYGSQQSRVGVFDALRILAQAYRGCFDDRLGQGLVKLFR